MTIISFEHRFIFVKTRKVAGTSVEASLREITGPEDIVTTLTPRDEFHCASRGLHARNYAGGLFGGKSKELRYTELVLAEQLEEAIEFSGRMRKKYNGHMRAQEIRRKLGRANFADFYKFSIERSPYSWLISIAAFDKRGYNSGALSPLDLEQIRERIAQRLSRRNLLERANYGYYTIDNQLAVDRVIRYENLEAEFREVIQHLGITEELAVPHLKVNPQALSAREIFTPELEALVQERFAPVFDLLGYPRSLSDG